MTKNDIIQYLISKGFKQLVDNFYINENFIFCTLYWNDMSISKYEDTYVNIYFFNYNNITQDKLDEYIKDHLLHVKQYQVDLKLSKLKKDFYDFD